MSETKRTLWWLLQPWCGEAAAATVVVVVAAVVRWLWGDDGVVVSAVVLVVVAAAVVSGGDGAWRRVRTRTLFVLCGSFDTNIMQMVVLAATRLALWRMAVHNLQLDVKNAFLYGYLSEIVYMHQPPGFQDPRHLDHVCLLQRSLYGLRQALRDWFQRFAAYAARVGFHHSRCDSSLFIYRHRSDTAYLLLYVDDIVLTASSSTLLQHVIGSLYAEFSMTDLGPLNYFLGIYVTRNTSGMFLSQSKYATKVLERANMLACNPCQTPIDTYTKLAADGDPVSDPTLYRSLAGALQYLTFTRPDVSYAVHAEAEYRGVANAVAETYWLRNLLRELYTPLSTATIVYSDNVSAVYLSSNPVQHQRTKHIEIDIHFVRDLVTTDHVRVLHVPSRYQYADIFTKGLLTALFDEFRSSLSVRSSPA
ncbi:ribonuclease H-like domain-containing protein [Tanacetum coccineum]|uniref:Ribonuclease H-like domain-containing protein n=1 Tax=Tanacetum coccineum TaxID=301880 RepID=A0ABQ4X820_9ASTR